MWWLERDGRDIQYDFTGNKREFRWISMVRQPEFVTPEIFSWACDILKKKRPELDFSKARFETYTEGLCVQIMHQGPYDDEPASMKKMEEFVAANNLEIAIGKKSPEGLVLRHHEIYLNDPRKTAAKNLKTVLRHPVRKLQ
ncbi:GyrI-like domain-containing protein [Brucepastera parasyntrophica]|uniref:GyrI-like domain-containing protein n=1 Tax=Brucepastera parasyntrophica TaxID=2880008 RepID=UPI00210CC85E|nr:GyrI-like domain-containing protein [Brucepastera parasyntrophica]